MTPEQEDALVESCYVDCKKASVGLQIYLGKTLDEPAIRLAIRAAYAQGVAQERERCAKLCELNGADWITVDGKLEDAAAAIRRGE